MRSPDNPNQILQKVHELGSATEELFNRIYRGLYHRNEEHHYEIALQQMTEQARTMMLRNRRLRQIVEDSSLEVDRLRAILSSISEGIIMQDTEGRIVMMNDAARRLLGNQRNFWRTELGVLFSQHRDIQTIGRELAPLSEVRRVEIENRTIGVQIAAVADSQDERIGTIMVLYDVTRDDLGERLKNSFITHISHELITPLAPMRLASEVLLSSPEDAPPNRRMLEMISRNVDILDRMVTDMLDMSAMASGQFGVASDRVMVEPVIWSVVDSFVDEVVSSDLEIIVMIRDSHRLKTTGDKKYLHRALTNLVRNAIQYNDTDGHIFVTAKSTDSLIHLEVTDNGAGISDTDLPHIFDLFYRGEPRTRDNKRLDPRGLGQGLYVSQQIAEAHNGTLTVQSALHQGSTFTLILPVI